MAARKAKALIEAGADVTVIAPRFHPAILAPRIAQRACLQRRRYRRADLDHCVLVVAATSDAAVNRRVADDAARIHRLCNVVDDAALSSAIVPAVVDRSPVQVAISTGGRSPVLARRLKSLIERLLPSCLGATAEALGRLRAYVREQVPDLARRRRVWESVVDALLATEAPPQRVGPVAQKALRQNASATPGVAHLVGAGPGDPDLLTVKAQRLLADADVVLHDRLVAPAILARGRRDAEFIDVGKTPNGPRVAQSAINRMLIQHVRAGKRVVRLKGGDPYIFGRGGEEMQALRDAGLEAHVVPGVTAAQGCAAAAGIPLTHRGVAQTVAYVTAHRARGQRDVDWGALARAADTLVIYMGVAALPRIQRALLRHRGPQTPVAIIENGTTPSERIRRTTLGDVLQARAHPPVATPALIIVGETAKLDARLRAAA